MQQDPTYSATSPRVLVIDDDKGLREIIRMTLVPRCEVKTAASVDEGLKIFESLHPNIVIIDYQMPIKNGIQGIREIREIDPEVPIILLTAYADIDMAREAMDLGVTEYMTKPFNVTDLKQTVELFTNPKSANRSETPQSLPPHTPRFEFNDPEPQEFEKLEPLAGSDFSPPSDLSNSPAVEPTGPALGRLFLKENYLECTTPKGTVFRSNILRLNPRSIVCEVFNPKLDIQVGDVLTDCTIQLGKPSFFIGKSTVQEIINTSILVICEISLQEDWYHFQPDGESTDTESDSLSLDPAQSTESAQSTGSAPNSKIEPLFKRVVSQFSTLLSEIHDAMKQFEARIHATDTVKRSCMENYLMQALSARVVPAMNRLSERFEEVASTMPAESEELHRLYVRHNLNRHLPFLPDFPRSSERPVGCPGDYRIPDRIFEPPPPESPLYDKTIRNWLLSSPPGEAIGYRTNFLAETLRSETARCREAGRTPRIFTIARGPVPELEEFIAGVAPGSDEPMHLSLLGFSEESINETRESVAGIQEPSIQADFVLKSVNQFLAEGNRILKSDDPVGGNAVQRAHYDVIYCSSLFHHFSDRVCQRLMEIFYEMLAPGGLIVACDLTPRNPLRHLMNFVFDENLIHRTRQEMLALVPPNLPPEFYRITEVPNGVEVFLHVLKPESVTAA